MNGIGNKVISLDTNIFIYNFEQNPHFAISVKRIFEKLEANQFTAITSIISQIEVLSFKMPPERVDLLQQLFLQTPNLTIYDVNQTIAIEAARIRRTYRFRLGDTIQLATALYGKADVFITNDEKIKSFTEMKIVLISEM